MQTIAKTSSIKVFSNNNAQTLEAELKWHDVCLINDLVIDSGVCALLQGQQIALFALSGEDACQPSIYAVDNFDPIGQANVISRGIVGSVGDEPVVASPLYKQHFSLLTGQCIEQSEHCLKRYPARLIGDLVQVALTYSSTN